MVEIPKYGNCFHELTSDTTVLRTLINT